MNNWEAQIQGEPGSVIVLHLAIIVMRWMAVDEKENLGFDC